MNNWNKKIASWQVNNVLYLSIPFTWLVNEAILVIKNTKKKVIVGGPGALLMKDKFEGIAEIRKSAHPFEPIIYHNPFATFTTRGCINKCPFCAVPKIEGSFREIKNFVPRPLICDNNFLAATKKHVNNVIEKLKPFPYIDFNQGLEARLFTSEIADKFCSLKNIKIRFSFDKLSDESYVIDAINLATKKGLKNIYIYVLFGFNDTPTEALYKAELIRKMGVGIYAMRYQPLNCLNKNEFINISKGWTDYELKRFSRYWRGNNNIFKIPFNEYDHRKDLFSKNNFGLIPTIKQEREDSKRWK